MSTRPGVVSISRLCIGSRPFWFAAHDEDSGSMVSKVLNTENRNRRKDIDSRRGRGETEVHALCLIRMNRSILQLRPDLRHQHLHLLCLPIQSPRQQTQADPFQPINMRQELKPASLFQYFILRPRVHGAFEEDLLNVDESGSLKPGKVVSIARNRAVVVCGGFNDDLGPVDKVAGGREGGVVGGETGVKFLEFEVATGLGVPGNMIVSE